MKFHMLKLFLMEKVILDEAFGVFSSPYILGIEEKHAKFHWILNKVC
jgi:hypothetical protein